MPGDIRESDFTKRLQFAGVFERDQIITQTFSMEVVYSTINDHAPFGLVHGTNKDYHALERLFRKPWVTSPLCVIRSISPSRPPITCSEVLISGLNSQRFSDQEDAIVNQVIGRFSIGELTIRTKYSDKSGGKRQQVFMIEGPRNLWLSRAVRMLSYTGAIQSQRTMSTFSLRGAPYDKLTVAPHFFYANANLEDRDRRKTVQHESFSLAFADKKNVERNEAAFLANTTSVTETLCLLMGFLSKARMDWSSSVFSDGIVIVETYRDVPRWKGSEPGWEEIILASKDIRRFLNAAYTAYGKNAEATLDLKLPILHYISAQSSSYVEDRFMLLFFALEKLLSALDAKRKQEPLLTSKQLSSLWANIMPALVEMKKSSKQINNIRDKIKELERYPLRSRIVLHLNKLHINIDDIGGESSLGAMIKIRNLLAHHHNEVKIEGIVFETRRLETIVERMLLRLLGWRRKNHTPTSQNWPVHDEN